MAPKSLADQIQNLEKEIAQKEEDLDTINMALQLDPPDADALEMKPMAEEEYADLKSRLAALRAKQDTAAAPPPPPPPPPGDGSGAKFSKESSTGVPPPPEEARITFNTGDSVLAKYSVDKSWYPATILGKTGSSTDPVYTVKFTGYSDKETKRKHEVRAVENKKRKAESMASASTSTAAPPPPPSAMPVQHGNVISAAPSIDPNVMQKREPSKVSDGPTRMAPAPKKLKGNRTLEKAKSSWNDWQKTGPKKPVIGAASKKLGKESQFRTPDLPNAKVGFTGSGKPMSKDQARTTWTYGREEPDLD